MLFSEREGFKVKKQIQRQKNLSSQYKGQQGFFATTTNNESEQIPTLSSQNSLQASP